MNINQGGMDNRFAQFQGGQAQPGTGAFPGLGGMQGLQSIPGGGQFPNLQQGQMQGRPGGLGGMPGAAQAAGLAAQQQRMSSGLGIQQQLNNMHQAAGAGRMPGPGGQQAYTTGVNGMPGMRLGAPGGVNPSAFQSMPQQGQQQPGMPGRAGVPLSTIPGLNGPGMGNLAFQAQNRGLGGSQGNSMGGLSGFGQRGVAVGGGNQFSGPPSGDLMSILSKAGPQRGQEEGPSFNLTADFPSLSSSGQGGGRHSSQDGANETFAALLHSQKQPPGMGGAMGLGQGAPFGDEDFPALPGAGAGGGRQEGSAGAAQLQQLQQQMGVAEQQMGAYDAVRMQQQQAQQQQQQQQRQQILQQQAQQQQHQQAAAAAAAAAGMKSPGGGGIVPGAAGAAAKSGGGGGAPADRYGLLGLLSVIRMTDPDVTTLALGTDLTTLGLNLNSPEALWKTFSSPWADTPGKSEPDFRTPSCYLSPPPRLTPAYFAHFQPDTLFYIFYGMPGDEAQVYAADELSNRGWYYHKELKTWLTRAPNSEPLQKTEKFERGAFFLFDPATWDVVRKENLIVSFDALERPPGLLKTPPPQTGAPPQGQQQQPGAMPAGAK